MAVTENRYNPTKKQREELIPIIKEYLENVKSNPEKLLDLYGKGIAPYPLKTILMEDFGFEDIDFYSNGWEMDYWITLFKDRQQFVIAGTGMTHEIVLRLE